MKERKKAAETKKKRDRKLEPLNLPWREKNEHEEASAILISLRNKTKGLRDCLILRAVASDGLLSFPILKQAKP